MVGDAFLNSSLNGVREVVFVKGVVATFTSDCDANKVELSTLLPDLVDISVPSSLCERFSVKYYNISLSALSVRYLSHGRNMVVSLGLNGSVENKNERESLYISSNQHADSKCDVNACVISIEESEEHSHEEADESLNSSFVDLVHVFTYHLESSAGVITVNLGVSANDVGILLNSSYNGPCASFNNIVTS